MSTLPMGRFRIVQANSTQHYLAIQENKSPTEGIGDLRLPKREYYRRYLRSGQSTNASLKRPKEGIEALHHE